MSEHQDGNQSEESIDDSAVENAQAGFQTRIFGTPEFFRLWLAQVVSATGDWLGLLAISILAIRVGSGSEGAALSLVLVARIAPGFFFGPIAGVLVDRWDRKKVMVRCDLGRAAVMVALPFVDTILGLVIASLILEALTMLWSPAKEASVPNLVPERYLTTANSLSMIAAYGTFPIGAGLMALFGRLSTALFSSEWADGFRLHEEGLAFYANALTFLIAAGLIFSLDLPHRLKRSKTEKIALKERLAEPINDLREGWNFIFVNPVARTVNMGLATALIGGGMLVPLGAIYATEVLNAGDGGFGFLITALGLGMAVGVGMVSWVQRHLSKTKIFTWSLVAAGTFLIVSASTSQIHFSGTMTFCIGMCAGSVYVLGFTLLHENVADELRGRIFSTFYLLTRMCVLIALVVGPLLEETFDRLSKRFWERDINIFGFEVFVPGVRLTLWLAALIMLTAGLIAIISLRSGQRTEDS
ncbi:MAG: Putative bacilysin exporter BacE [Acidimicrobiales bacterium AG-410-I20]|nr:MAG: Putative bacilysin exporter BacE [Acidimicrobiales bacterium AG-410-I20]